MKKTIKLTEKDLTKIIQRIISENMDEDNEMMDVSSDSDYYQARKREVNIPFDELAMLGHFATRFCESRSNLPDCQTVNKLYSKYQLFM